MYNSTKEIREKFIKDGWTEYISFTELSLEEAKKEGIFICYIWYSKGKKYFKMNIGGNIYDNKGEIVLFKAVK